MKFVLGRKATAKMDPAEVAQMPTEPCDACAGKGDPECEICVGHGTVHVMQLSESDKAAIIENLRSHGMPIGRDN